MRGFRAIAKPRALIAALAVFVALCSSAAFADLTFPPLTGRVVDDAGVLSDNAKARLTAMSQALQQKNTDQLVIATLKSLQGNTIEQYGYQLGRHWGIGQKGHDNGALLIIVPSEHKVRIEVGYGLEGQLTDAQSSLIIQNVILPAFRRGDYDGGTLAGAATILQVFGVETKDVAQVLAQQQQLNDTQQDDGHGGGGFPIIIAVIVIWFVFGRFLWPLLFLGGGGGRGPWGGGGFGGGSFGGGGGGGFSGGGGSFGGGGASGSW